MKTHLIQPSATDTPAVQIHLLGRAPYSSRDPVRMHALGIALQRQQGVHAIASDRRVDFDTWPGTLSYTPPGVEVFSESATGGEYLVLRYAAHEADAPRPSQRISQHGQRSALQMAQHLRLLLLSPQPDALAIEQAALRFMACQEGSACGGDARPGAGYARVLERIAAEKRAAAEARAAQLNELVVTITANVGEEGKLFGSIGTQDIADALTASGIEAAKSEVRLSEGTIRQTGEYDIKLQLHTEVVAEFKLVVAGE